MATIYMKVTPPVIEGGGSVTAKGYEGWMELTSLTKTVERAIKQSAETSTNREAAHPQIQPFECSRMGDVATPGMFGWSVGGKPRKVQIHLCQPGDKGAPLAYATYELDNCVLSKMTLKDEAEGAPSEDFSISFTKIAYEFKITDTKNQQKSAGMATYDLVVNSLL